jgi:hypothetical protein
MSVPRLAKRPGPGAVVDPYAALVAVEQPGLDVYDKLGRRAPERERWEIYTVLEDSATFWGQDGSRSWDAAEAALDSAQVSPAQTAPCCGGSEESGRVIGG